MWPATPCRALRCISAADRQSHCAGAACQCAALDRLWQAARRLQLQREELQQNHDAAVELQALLRGGMVRKGAAQQQLMARLLQTQIRRSIGRRRPVL